MDSEMIINGIFDYKGRSSIDFHRFKINNGSRYQRELTPSKYWKSAEIIVSRSVYMNVGRIEANRT